MYKSPTDRMRSLLPYDTSEAAIGRALAAALDYIASRECRSGGFCAYRTDELEEPNLRDTYYAVAACRLLGRLAFDHDRLTRHLLGAAAAARSIHALYYYAFTVHRLGKMPAAAVIERISRLHMPLRTLTAQMPRTARLDTMLKAVRVKKVFARLPADPDIANIILATNDAESVGDKPNLEDTRLAVSLLAELDCPDKSEYVRRFVDELQVPATGFRLTYDSAVSNMDVIYAGIVSCTLLDLPVRYPEDIVRFVLLSQRASGGFSRAPGSQGDMRTHYRALAILGQLRSVVARMAAEETGA